MSSAVCFLISTLYLWTTTIVAKYEYHEIKRVGADSFTIVLAFVFINLLLPGVGIYGLLGIFGSDLRTGIYFFDKVLLMLNFIDSLTVYLLTNLFILGLYISIGFSRTTIFYKDSNKKIELRPVPAFISISFLFVLCGTFFIGLGQDTFERYANLILFRIQDTSIDRTFFSANAFALTQTLLWLSTGMFFYYAVEKKHIKAAIHLCLLLFAGLLMGSRRGLIYPFIILYFGAVLLNQKLYMKKVIYLIPIIILWVSYGKELASSVSRSMEFEYGSQYSTVGSLMLRAFSDIGISLIESLAVLQHFSSFLPRLGFDHLLSVLRRLPEGLMGLEIDWPERIVLITTKAFTYSGDSDIPPGLIGQSWLDLPIIGALLWGMFIGAQSRFINNWARGIIKSPAQVILVVLLGLIIALPIGTGSYDFTFSIDIFVFILLLKVSFKYKYFISPKK